MATVHNPPAVPTGFRIRRFLARACWMALLWLGLNGFDANSWKVGVPVVLTATWVSVKLLPAISWRLSPGGAFAFATYFLRESFRGGWDVARRALCPRLALSPAFVCHPFQLPKGPSRLFFCSVISLLPGTAVVGIEDSNVYVHVLDNSTSVEEELRELECRVGRLFGLELIKEKEPAT